MQPSDTPAAVEMRVRRRVARTGYALRKSRARHGINNHGHYQIVDPVRNTVVVGKKFDMTLLNVVDWLIARLERRVARAAA